MEIPKDSHGILSHSNSPTSLSMQLDADLNEPAFKSTMLSGNNVGHDIDASAVEQDPTEYKSNESLNAGAPTESAAATTTSTVVAEAPISDSTVSKYRPRMMPVTKPFLGSRLLTRKMNHIKIFCNGDRFYPGLTIPVSADRYKSIECLFEDLTHLLGKKIPNTVRAIYTLGGKKICKLEQLEEGQNYVCCCYNEAFKKMDYNITSQPADSIPTTSKAINRPAKANRPMSPPVASCSGSGVGSGAKVSQALLKSIEPDSVVRPRLVTVIRNGTKPRKIMRLLLNKRNSASFEHVLTAITQMVLPDTGYVRKVFTLSGHAVVKLADFFDADDVFFAYGTERVNFSEDFKLDWDERKAMRMIAKSSNRPIMGIVDKATVPETVVKTDVVSYDDFIGAGGDATCFVSSRVEVSGVVPPSIETTASVSASLMSTAVVSTSMPTPPSSPVPPLPTNATDQYDLPSTIIERFLPGKIIGDGNFAYVMKMTERQGGQPYALKVIDKYKCYGKERYIEAEVRIMSKLQHPHIIQLYMDFDQVANRYLVLEFVGGGDLFDAIGRHIRFPEKQARLMMQHLGSALEYLHANQIAHRDIKPENLLVQSDHKGNIIELKVADFGLACEFTRPMYAVCGTASYVAPEILTEVGYDLKVDVWAAGVILYILMCGYPPFTAADKQQETLFKAIIAGVYSFTDPHWRYVSRGVRDLISNMLKADPAARFSSADVMDHYWLNPGSQHSSSI